MGSLVKPVVTKGQLMSTYMPFRRLAGLGVLVCLAVSATSQERLKTFSRYERYERMRRDIPTSVRRGDVSAQWDATGKTLYFTRDGKSYAFDVATKRTVEGAPPENAAQPGRGGRRGGVERGRQFDSATSPDGKLKAFHRDRNLHISDAAGTNSRPVTTDGSVASRIKYGIASWVYGEEFGVRDAIWWSPDSTLVAFYRFDESKVKDYFIAFDQLKIQSTLDAEPYPKAGAENPGVELHIHNPITRKSQRIDTTFDSGSGAGVGHYVYQVRWSPDGKELLYNRTNRKQNVMEFCAADPSTGKSRVVVRETSTTWTDNAPSIVWLDEARPGPKRFLWRSERNGFYNWYLYDLSGKLHNAVTKNSFEAGNLVRVVSDQGLMFYMARSGETPYKMQLHRARLDGSDDRRLTDPRYHHTVNVAPDGRHFVDTAEKTDETPTTRLAGLDGKAIETLSQSNATQFQALGLKKTEVFTYIAADGKTVCYGELHKPSDFDPQKKYPVIVEVYGGPDSGGSAHRFQVPSTLTELGFLVASFDGRGTNGRGRAFKDAVYGKLGIVEIDDQAAGVRELIKRPYVDATKIGIHGSSYGGYAAAMAILRYPDLFRAAVASSPVTDWRNYDSVYTERYMGLPSPSENEKGYDEGSCMKYAANLKGKLMLYFGTADNNVHPSNTFQLCEALVRAEKPFDLMAGADRGHTGLGTARTLEYFIDAFDLK